MKTNPPKPLPVSKFTEMAGIWIEVLANFWHQPNPPHEAQPKERNMTNKNIKTIEVTGPDVRMTEIAAKALPAAVSLMDARGITPTKEQLTALSKRLSRASEFIGGAVPDNAQPADLESLAKEAASLVVDEIFGSEKALS